MLRLTLARAWITCLALTCARAHSCHEVRSAFQLRQVGPAAWVPDTADTDAELQICRHQGPTCCTRRMEQSYQTAARRDTLHNVLSYSFELKYLITSHATAFQDTFHSLLSFTLNHTLSLFDLAYEPVARDARPLVSALFADLALYLHGNVNISIERSVHRFFDDLFPLVYRHLVNPGLPASSWSAEGVECLRATRADVNPFGPHPQGLAQGLARALKAGRALTRALTVGGEVLNTTESVGLARDCGQALVRMLYCPHCRGLTLIRPCEGLCLNVMRGCLAGLAELQGPWRHYVALLEGMSGSLAGGHELELSLLGIRERINDAILSAQLRGPQLSAIVDKVCGPLTESITSAPQSPAPYSPEAQSPAPHTPAVSADHSTERLTLVPSPSPLYAEGHEHSRGSLKKRSLPLKPSKNDKPRSLKKIAKEFMGYIQRYKPFFYTLPEMLCEGEMVVDDYTCWSGEDVVESYTGPVVGNGFQAQRLNPEVRVRGMDPILVEAKEKLERFNQEMWDETGLRVDAQEHVDMGSGSSSETSGECDDEDGCEGSGEDEDMIDTDTDEVLPSFRPPTDRSGPGKPVSAAACPCSVSFLLLFFTLSLLLLSPCSALDSA